MKKNLEKKWTPDEVQAALGEKGVRFTKKRAVVLEAMLNAAGHLTIDEILFQVKKLDPRIGYVTVYRTLKIFKECGFVNQWQFGDGFSRFEKTGDHHDHLICLKCGKILEFEEDEIEALQKSVAKRYHFQIVSHVHEIYGYCKECVSVKKI
ncbi:MAG: transcriptional repressor [Deltaproteobacteria bacterium]|nr:transcriptional repressor [Deltaproteobacteria bacterium]